MAQIPTLSRDEADRSVEAAFSRHKRGDLESAAAVYQRILSIYPEHAQAMHYLGLIAQQRGSSADAVRLLNRSIQIDPKDPRTHNHLGQVYVVLKDNTAAVRCFERALQLDPNHIDSLNNLANVARLRDLAQAIRLYRRVLELNPKAPFALYNLAKALSEDNAFDDALALYEQTIVVDPLHYQARFNMGVLLEQKGRFREAMLQYRTVQQIRPKHVSSLANLIAMHDYQPDIKTVARAKEMAVESSASVEDRIKLHRGIGKNFDRGGDYDRAFRHFQRSKALARTRVAPFDIARVSDNFERLISAFSAAVFSPESPRGDPSARPVFIVGMPRSGTTLTEQILASHPAVFGAGEIGEIPKIVKSLRPEYPESVASMNAAALQTLADQYLDVLQKLGGETAVRITDKMPINTLHLGMIAKLLPAAHVVYVRRDPLDIAISSLMELFEFEQDFTTDLGHFGHYFLEHERLMNHWRKTLPLAIHEVRYEDLIANPEAASRALVDFCGLDWDPRCLNFWNAERTIRTPSRWQARQPIYQTSVGRWYHYADHMQPLIQVLEAASFRYGGPSTPMALRAAAAPIAMADEPALASPSKVGTLPRVLQRLLIIVAAPRSGSTLLFETLAASENMCTLGGEAHQLVEEHLSLRPGAPGVDSNRLTAANANEEIRDQMIAEISRRLVGHDGVPESIHSELTLLEKTPKNALRIPFFDTLFPEARFLFLWRDPRENISSIMDAWRSGGWITYKQLRGWHGPWSLLLPPGWQQLQGKPLETIAAYQWQYSNATILHDLQRLDRDRWFAISYRELIAEPEATISRVAHFAGIPIGPSLAARLASELPLSRYTHTQPAPEKWRKNEDAVLRALPTVESTWRELVHLADGAPCAGSSELQKFGRPTRGP